MSPDAECWAVLQAEEVYAALVKENPPRLASQITDELWAAGGAVA